MAEKRKNLNDLISYILLTDEFKNLAGNQLPVLLNEWAGKNIFKKFIAKIFGKSIEKGFLSKRKREISSMYEKKEFIETISKAVPELLNLGIENVSNFTESLMNMAEDEQSEILGNLAGGVDAGKAGKAITDFAVTLRKIHKYEPEFLSRALQPVVRDLIESVDFGELRDFIDSSNDGFRSITKMINEEMWRYPSKMILLLSFIPSALNIALIALHETLNQINKIAPDLLSDVMLALFNDVDGEEAGELLNEINEIIRKIETGSALIGEPGESSISAAVVTFTEKLINRVNPEILIKSRDSMNRMKVIVKTAALNAMSSHPELVKGFFVSSFKNFKTNIAVIAAKSDVFFDLFTDDEIAENIINGLNEIDAQEISEMLNHFISNMNAVYRENPEYIGNFFVSLSDSIDYCELESGIKNLVSDIAESIKPYSNIIMPPVLDGITELLSPDEGPSDELKESLARFRNLIMAGEEVYE